MANLSVALAIARAYLNDDAVSTWNDAALIPKAQEAHRELQEELWISGSPVVRAQTTRATITIGSTSMASPADMMNPTSLFEATIGQNDWVPMTEQFYLPLNITPVTNIVFWAWRGEGILLNPASTGRDVIVQYRRLITIPAAAGDPIGIIFGESYIGARTAGIAAGALSNLEAMNALTEIAQKNLARVIVANRGTQKPPNRPA